MINLCLEMSHQLHGVLCLDDPDAIQNAICQGIDVRHTATPSAFDDLSHSTCHSLRDRPDDAYLSERTNLLAENLPSVSKYITFPSFLQQLRIDWLIVM